MKRPLQLSLAIALALAGTDAMALGLGPVRVMSRLNQPLQAEIPVIQGTAGEAEGLLVSLADQEDFERLGISRSNLGVPLEFSVAKDAHGQTVIRVTSKEPVRSTYLDFLLEANWPKGRMLREYTVLLDPPVTAPASPAPTAVAAAPAAAPKATPPRAAEPVRETPAPAPVKERPVAHATPAKPAPAPAPARKVVEGEYGPTQAGQTLSAIARETRPAGANVNQMMLALLKSNPDAFYRNNINTLKRGVILRVPSADEVKAIGSASEAAQQVQAQIEDWRGGHAVTTRLAADSAPPPAAAKPAKTTVAKTGGAKSDERLELVPPKAGKDSLAMADRPGAGGAGSAGSNTEMSHELARAKEALAASDQATGELKSRVKDLEDIKNKNERLISLKDSEIAELQQKLKELQAGKATSAASAPASAKTETPAKPEAPAAATPIDKKDIWGDAGKAAPSADHKDAPVESKPAADAKPAGKSAATEPVTPAPATADAAKMPATPAPAADKSASAPNTTTPNASTPTGMPATTMPLAESTPAPAASTTPHASTPTPAPAKPTPTPAKPAVVRTQAAPQAAWYDADWVKPAAIGGALILALLGFLGMRKRKASTAAVATGSAPSIADAFGDTPFDRPGTDVMASEVEHLHEQIAADPSNLGAHLELLSVYYAERDVARFEEAAEQMHAHVVDPQQAEWLEAQAMGEELAPHNPLWASASGDAYEHAGHDSAAPAFDEAFEEETFVSSAPATGHDSFVPADDIPDFGFGTPAAHSPEPAFEHAASSDFGFEDIPPLEEHPVSHEPEPVAPAAMPADDFFADEDAVATKIDLAKAYMDMGDPDGARSMLEEVLSEGNEAQRTEAQRLIEDLR